MDGGSFFDDGCDRGHDRLFSLSAFQAFDLLVEFPPSIRNRLFSKAFRAARWQPVPFSNRDAAISYLEQFAVEAQTAGPDWPHYGVFREIKRVAERLYNDMRRAGLDFDDIQSAWMPNSAFYGDVAERVELQRLLSTLGEAVDANALDVSGVAHGRRRKGRALRSIVDHLADAAGPHSPYIGECTRAVVADHDQGRTNGLKRRWWTDGERAASLSDIAEFEERRKRAETATMVKGIHQIADARGDASLLLTITLPGRFSPGEIEGAGPEEAKAALTTFLRRFRAALSGMRGDYEIESWHETRADALARKAETERSPCWAARTKKVDRRWTTQRAPLLGRQALGVVAWHPTERGVPHLHISMRCNDAIVDALKAWLASQEEEYGCALSVRAHDEGDASEGTNYSLRHVLGDSQDNRDAREWGRERGIRLVGWIGMTPARTVWRAIHSTPEVDIPVERARAAKVAMGMGRFDSVLRSIGSVHCLRDEFPRLRLAYETVQSATGNFRRRPIGVFDPTAPDQGMILLRPQGVTWEAQVDGTDEKMPIARVNDPSEDADDGPRHPPNEPFDWSWAGIG